MKKSLKTKLVISILATILIFGSISTAVTFFYTRNIIFDIQKENIKKLTLEQSYETGQLLANVAQLSRALSTQSQVINYLSKDIKEFQNKDVLMHLHHYNIEESFSALYVIDVNGQTVASTDPSFVGNNYSFRDYFKKAMAGEQAMDVVLGVTSKKLGYYFAAPVLDETQQVIGVTVIKMRPEIIDGTLHIGENNVGSHVMLTDQYGVVISTDRADRLYKSLGELSERELMEIEEKRRFQGIDIEALQYGEVKKLLGNQGVQAISIYDEVDEEEEILSFVQLEDWPLYLVIEEDLDIYLSYAIRIAYILSLVVILSAIISSLVIFFFINNFIKPIKKLHKVSQDIASGKLESRANIKTGDEFEDLANSFNKMAAKLQVNIRNIEKKIKDRTETLEKLNRSMVGREIKMIELKNKLKNKK